MIMIQTGLGVALRKESVDRNFNAVQIVIVIMVALRKESVDRNSTTRIGKKVENVALRKESVDRNTSFCPASLCGLPSLSARRAWIEMAYSRADTVPQTVALRKESVDRNYYSMI